MKKLLLLGIAMMPLSVIHSIQAQALIVECANCSTLEEELISDGRQAEQLATQLQQRATQLQQYQTQLTNLVALPSSIWTQVQADIASVRNLANAASLLTGNSGSILTRLQSAQGYASQASFLPSNIGQQFTMWQNTIANANNSLGRALATQQAQEQTYATQQAAMNAQSQNAVGQLQAIQAGNQLASLTATQLNQMQTTLTAAAQAQATRDIAAADRTASEDAATLKFLQAQQLPTTGGVRY
jgi:P-type conjugative transfer protein TrbJ